MPAIREPAVAGTFYPDQKQALQLMVDNLLYTASQALQANTATKPALEGLSAAMPKAIIAPHAGYVYSGKTAASVYAEVQRAAIANQDAGEPKDIARRVVLLGPSHHVAFSGIALPTATTFSTPLGDIAVDTDAIQGIAHLTGVSFRDDAHLREHSLEVHLPFLQQSLGDFRLVPIVVGDADPATVARVLEALWGGEETLVVVSTDLSHFLDDAAARQSDNQTRQLIEALDPCLTGQQACGCRPVNGLLHFLKNAGMQIEFVDATNSGDVGGDKSRVVGYGAWRIPAQPAMRHARHSAPGQQPAPGSATPNGQQTPEHEETMPNPALWSTAERQLLLHLARTAILGPLNGESNLDINLKHYSNRLTEEYASFVTLNIQGQLRGCIGSLQAHRSLILDVASNAQSAAFKDPRFTPLTMAEYPALELHISILTRPEPLNVNSAAALAQVLRPGIDGLIIEEDGKRATYLPSVWSQLPDPEQFVAELRRKAGLNPNDWTERTSVYQYRTEQFC